MILSVHQKFALVLILLGLLGALWCFIDLRRQGAPSGGVRAFLIPVSYTHLDVYKRQVARCESSFSPPRRLPMGPSG